VSQVFKSLKTVLIFGAFLWHSRLGALFPIHKQGKSGAGNSCGEIQKGPFTPTLVDVMHRFRKKMRFLLVLSMANQCNSLSSAAFCETSSVA
jgi:hypothetical protein